MESAKEPVVLILPREVINAGDIEPVLQGLSLLVRSPSLAPQALGLLQITFSGYENDSRELFEVPEVRQFVSRLDAVFPYWFYLADLASETLLVLASCLCRSAMVRGAGAASISREDLRSFIARQFGGMNQLFDQWHLPMELNVRRSKEITDYLSAREILN